MESEKTANDLPELVPVLFGGDTGVYALARCFYEAYAVKAYCLAPAPTAAITHSKIANAVVMGEKTAPRDYIDAAIEIANNTPGARRILLANTDWHIKVLNDHRAELEEYFSIPVVSVEVAEKTSDKVSFMQLCESLGIPTPRTIVQDFSSADEAEWHPAEVSELGYPLIAKPAFSAEYKELKMENKKKVWVIADQEEASQLWENLRNAGFRGQFLAQELIPGDDTAMRSLTAYVDRNKRVVLTGSARVLLEDHAPTMLGNPVAMITEEFPEMMEQAIKLLETVGYSGFANFDIKVDPRDGRAVFFEVNPRIGRNCYYLTAAGKNPMKTAVRDLIFERNLEPERAEKEVLYTLLPHRLLLRYIRDEIQLKRVKQLIAEKRFMNPLHSKRETNLRRAVLLRIQDFNQFRKYAKFYPEPTDSSF